MIQHKIKASLTLATLLTVPLSAAVTYVDATLANTSVASGTPSSNDNLWADGNDGTTGGSVSDGSANNDGLWRFRSGFGNGGIWEASGSNAQLENAVEILTTVPVANGVYNAYVFYYPVGAGPFPIRAGFTSNPNANTIYDSSEPAASTLTFTVAPPTGTEGRTLLVGSLGQTTVTTGNLDIYIDDLPAVGLSSSSRTWYAGIGYELVPIPEPSVSLLLGLAGMTLLRRRR